MIINHDEDGKHILSVEETEPEHKIESLRAYIKSLALYNQSWKTEPTHYIPDISLENEEIVRLGETQIDNFQENPNNQLPGCTIKLVENSEVGRHIVAPRHIRAGEVIVVEPPYVIGPMGCSAVCLKCLSQVDGNFSCEECGFYFCGTECLSDDHKDECIELSCLGLSEKNYKPRKDGIASRIKQKMELRKGEQIENNTEEGAQKKILQKFMYKASEALQSRKAQVVQRNLIVTTLRTLREMEAKESKCATIMGMQANVVPESPQYEAHNKSMVNPILCKIRPNVDPDFLQRIAAVWDTNCFEVLLKSGGKAQGMYPLASLINHTCKANLQQSYSNSGSMIIRAIDDIPEGESLSLWYMSPLWPTRMRRKHLLETKHFECCCQRCKDPTELGSFMGSPLCQECKSALLPDDSLILETDWHCSNSSCNYTFTKYQVSLIRCL